MKCLRKYLAVLLSLLMLIMAFPAGTIIVSAENTTEFLGGEGTEESPYLISTKDHLNNVRKYLDAHFKMVADIELDGREWIPIGEEDGHVRAFLGSFDGNGHTITGLKIYSTSFAGAGLFGHNKGIIRNLGLLNSRVRAETDSNYVDIYTGGIAGRNMGTISDCYNIGDVFATPVSYALRIYAGGIVGNNENGTISNCYHSGTVSATFNFASISTYVYAGGIAGANSGTLNNCYNTGELSAFPPSGRYVYAGGIVGACLKGIISGIISNCYNTATVSASSPPSVYSTDINVGGIAGSGEINNCYNTGAVSAISKGQRYVYAGGIAGSGKISNCYNIGSVTVTSDYDEYYSDIFFYIYAGGIAGSSGTITNCYNSGNVSAKADATKTDIRAGGIAGDCGTINNCYNTGCVSAAYNGDSVNNRTCAGGIVGRNSGTLRNCYNIGAISIYSAWDGAPTYRGGISGQSNGTLENCYYLNTITVGVGDGTDTAVICTAKQMIKRETFTGFDFDTVWNFNVGEFPFPTLQGLPYLEDTEENTKEFAGGTGSLYAPYLISTKAHLNNVRRYLGAHFKMIADIEFNEADFARGGNFYNSGRGWEPIGKDNSKPFFGSFDGNGHTIKGLFINADGSAFIGLFGYNQGIIRNLGLLNNCVSNSFIASGSNSSRPPCAGGIAGYNDRGTISNCYNTGSVLISSSKTSSSSYPPYYPSYVGGIAGYNEEGIISSCYNIGSVSASSEGRASYTPPSAYVGGISGHSESGIISNCYNTGSVSASSTSTSSNTHANAYAGGLLGTNGGKLSNCYNTGTVLASSTHSAFEGGIAGSNQTNGYISGCYYLDTAECGVGDELKDDKAIKCTAEQMKQQSTFKEFDFCSVWEIDEYGTYLYPQLKGNRQEPIQDIELLTPPNNATTLEGLFPDLTGATVKITCIDGRVVVTDATIQMLSELDINQTGKQTVHLTYGGRITADTLEIEVLPKSIVSIAVSTLPDKTIYVQGQPLDPTGGKLTIEYNNHTSEVIELNKAQLSYLPDKTGTVTVTAEYQGACTEFSITVTERVVRSIHLVKPTKLTYVEGQELDLTGGKLQVTYVSDDNYTEEIPLEISMVSGYDPDERRVQTLTVTYGGKTTTFEVTVEAKALVEIKVTKRPDKLTYLEGDNFDPTGMEVTATYNNGTSEVVKDYQISGYASTPGKKTITITYGEETATFEVMVEAKSLTEIKITKKPDKLTYLEGDDFDPTGLEITAYYNNGTSEKISDYDISGYTSTPGTKTITITYGGKTVAFEVTVEAKSLTEIRVTQKPSKLTYLEGDGFEPAGMEVTAYYNNGTSETVDNYQISGYDSMPGKKTITITFGGKTTTFEVTVEAKSLTEIQVTQKPTKLTYLEGEDFEPTGMEVTAYYNNGTSETVEDYQISGYAPTPGTKTITITYGEETTTFEVTVKAKTLVSIAVTKNPDKMTYIEGTDLDTKGMELTLTYDNGTKEVVTTGWTETYDFSQPGQIEVQIAYQGKKTALTVTVVAKSLTGIAVSQKPDKLTYLEGEMLDTAGMVVTASYNNGTSEPVTGYQVSGYSSTPGTKTITATYQGKTASFTVTVKAKSVSSIAMKSNPSKTTYLVGEALNLSGAKITVKYNNNTSEDIAVTTAMVSGYNADKIGEQTITVTYAGKTTSFKVTVQSRVPSSITSGTYNISGGFISKIGAGTTVSQLLNGLGEKAYCKVYKGNAEVSGDTPAGTGMEIRLLDGSTVKARVTVVVTGDTNGDGNITITDMLAVKSHLLKKSTLSGAAGKAADTSGDKAISITDFIQIKAHILGKDKVQARAC